MLFNSYFLKSLQSNADTSACTVEEFGENNLSLWRQNKAFSTAMHSYNSLLNSWQKVVSREIEIEWLISWYDRETESCHVLTYIVCIWAILYTPLCEGSRGFSLGFNSFQSFKSRFLKRRFLIIFNVFFVTNQRYHEQ